MSTNESTERTGRIEIVKLDDLHVDESYQRAIKMNLVQTIYNEWRDEACGIILVSRREDGSLWVVDGQHRVAAAKLLEMETLPARIVEGHSAAEEALLRIQTNRKRNETPAERFKAQLIAKFPDAVGIVRMLKSYGAKLALEGTKADAITCISTIELMYAWDKGVTLRQVFDYIYEADKKLNAENTETSQLRALHWFLDQHAGEYDRKRLITVLKQYKTALKARGEVLHSMMGGSTYINRYRALVEFYNENQPKKAQLESKTRGYRSVKKDQSLDE